MRKNIFAPGAPGDSEGAGGDCPRAFKTVLAGSDEVIHPIAAAGLP